MWSHGGHGLFFVSKETTGLASRVAVTAAWPFAVLYRCRLGAAPGHVSCVTAEHTQLEVEAVLTFLSSESVVLS